MSTESQKMCGRYSIYFLFWLLIVCLGCLLIPDSNNENAGSGDGFGNGPGTGTHGSGTGSYGDGTGSQGEGKGSSGAGSGKGDGKQNTGDSKNSAGAKETTAVHKADDTGKAEDKEKQKTSIVQKFPKAKKAQEVQLPIVSQNETSDDVASIYTKVKSSGNKSSSSGSSSAGFFGIKATGSTIYLLDISGSMGALSMEGISRLNLVKREMEKALIGKYTSRDHFRIVTFSSGYDIKPLREFSSRDDITESINYINGLGPCGGTDMGAAWRGIFPVIKQDKIQTVYFLSDGEPGDISAHELLNLLKQNVPELVIHTISMGTDSPLLKNIAKQHNGKYKQVH